MAKTAKGTNPSQKFIYGMLNDNYEGPLRASGGNIDRSQLVNIDYGSYSVDEPVYTYDDFTADEIADFLKELPENQCHGEEFDDMRTALFQKMKNDESEHGTIDSVMSSISEPDGGATVGVGDDVTFVTSGFALSTYPERSVAMDAKDITRESIYNYVKENEEVLREEGNYLGLWHDPETHKVYFDVSCIVDDASKARQLCKDNDQIAFFDMQLFQSVEVDRNATSGQAALQ